MSRPDGALLRAARAGFAIAAVASLASCGGGGGDRRKTGSFVGNPAIASDVLYATNQSPLSLQVLDEGTGTLQWSWVPQGANETTFIGDVLLTRNLVFFSTNVAVYAVDTTTRSMAWSYPKPGRVTLSNNKVLYIATTDAWGQSDGGLVAINVK